MSEKKNKRLKKQAKKTASKPNKSPKKPKNNRLPQKNAAGEVSFGIFRSVKTNKERKFEIRECDCCGRLSDTEKIKL